MMLLMVLWDIWQQRIPVRYDHLKFVIYNIIIVNGIEGVNLVGGLDLACCKHVV